jgi:hypothetical protein
MSMERRAATNTCRIGALGILIGALGMYVYLRPMGAGDAQALVVHRQTASLPPRSEAPPRGCPPGPAQAAAIAKPAFPMSVGDVPADVRADAPARAPVPGVAQLCAKATEHLFAIEFANDKLDVGAQQRVSSAREQVETTCRERWSAERIACIQHADEPYKLRKCWRHERGPAVEMPTSVGMDADVRCEVVGKYLADLTLAHWDVVTDVDDLRTFVTTDDDELDAMRNGSIDSCREDEWSDDLRRCYAGCGVQEQTVYCNLWFR